MQASPVYIYNDIDNHPAVTNAMFELLHPRYMGFLSIISFTMQHSPASQGRFYGNYK
jgi:hypothetical protein